MNDRKPNESNSTEGKPEQIPSSSNSSPTPKPLAASDVDPEKPVQQLSPEEQMALYEKQLKEDDWGHQPC